MTDAPRVSVVMRTKDSDWVVAQALGSLYSQTFTDFELIVFDSGSTDRTLDIIAQYPARLYQIEPEDYYPGPVLNAASSHARGDVLVFQNSDSVFLSPHTLERLLSAFDDSDVQAAFGRQVPRPEAEPWVRREYESSFPADGPAPPWIALSMPLAAIRTSAWRQLPFYDDAWGSEDTMWGMSARRRGWAIQYVADAETMHSHNYSLKQLYGRRFIEGEADAFIFGDEKPLWRTVASGVKAALQDLPWYVRARDMRGLMQTPARRFVYQYAYQRGRRLGEKRRASGDRDASVGQRAVLSRYGAKGE